VHGVRTYGETSSIASAKNNCLSTFASASSAAFSAKSKTFGSRYRVHEISIFPERCKHRAALIVPRYVSRPIDNRAIAPGAISSRSEDVGGDRMTSRRK